MNTITTKDGAGIYFKDWGPKNAQAIVFHHGWPLSADDWDTQRCSQHHGPPESIAALHLSLGAGRPPLCDA